MIQLYAVHKRHFRLKNIFKLKAKKIYHISSHQKRAVMVIFISDKTDIKTKFFTRLKEGQFTINGSIHTQDIAIINICGSKSRASEYMKEILTEERNSSIIETSILLFQ